MCQKCRALENERLWLICENLLWSPDLAAFHIKWYLMNMGLSEEHKLSVVKRNNKIKPVAENKNSHCVGVRA